VVGSSSKVGLLPQVGCQKSVSLAQSSECGLDEVSKGLGGSLRRGKDVLNTGELQNLLGGSSSDDTSSLGSGDHSHSNGTTLSGNLGGDGVGKSDLVSPISSSNGNDRELGQDDGTSDGCGNFLRALNAKSAMALLVSNNDESFKSGSLTSSSLLLDGHDLHDFVLQLGEEVIDDLVLFDGERVEIDLFQSSDSLVLH